MGRESSSLGIFVRIRESLSRLEPNTYFIDSDDPFHNIADKALNQEDYVPLYIEIAKKGGRGARVS